MAGYLAKVAPGDPLSAFSARSHNAFVDAAVAHLERDAGGGAPPPTTPRDDRAGTVVCVNATEVDIPRFGVVALAAPAFPTPAYTADQLERGRRAWAAAVPDTSLHRGRFAVALEPIPDGSTGTAAVSGVVPAMVDFGTTGPMPRADVADADVNALAAGTTGAAEILWAETTSGVSRAMVRLGPRATTPVLARVHTPVALAANRWDYSATVGAFGADGVWADGAFTVLARNREEYFNAATGVQGSGVDVANLPAAPATFAHVPVGPAVRAIEGPYDTGGATPFFYFSATVTVDGVCQ